MTSLLVGAAAATALWPCPGQAFVGGSVSSVSNCYKQSSRGCNRWATATTTSVTKWLWSTPLRMATVHDSAVDTTVDKIDRPSAETTLVRGRKVVHIAVGGRRPTAGECTICDLISQHADINFDRALELVKFGAVYIGEDARPPSSTSGHRELRRGRGGGEYKRVGRNPLTENQQRKLAAKKASGQLPFEGTDLDHINLRRLGHSEGMNRPPAGSYLRVHCDPRKFLVAEEVTWSDRIVAMTNDYVVVDKVNRIGCRCLLRRLMSRESTNCRCPSFLVVLCLWWIESGDQKRC